MKTRILFVTCFSKLFANPGAMKKMEGNDRQEVQKIVDSVEGIDMDLQDPITVKVK